MSQDGCSEGFINQSDSRYILKVELTRFSNVSIEKRKRELTNIFKVDLAMKRVTVPEIKIAVGEAGEQGGLGVVWGHVNEVAFQDTSRDVDKIAGYTNRSSGKRSQLEP